MKITKLMRFLLIAIAAVMVFSLFACGETPEETENTTEEIVDPVESSDNKPQDSEEVEPPVNTESSENQGGEGTEPESQETVTTETDEVVTTETESDEVITTETESDEVVTTETETEAKPECQHTELTDVEAKAATCTEAGNEAYKTCVCGKFILADGTVADTAPVIPALDHDWDEGQVTVAATCAAKGTKTFTCKNDATHTKTEDVDVDPANHVGETYIAKSTLEKKCASCDGVIEQYPAEVFGANGFNAYFGPDHLAQHSAITQGELSEDGKSVKFYGDGTTIEGYINIILNANNERALGRYLVVKYNASHMTSSNYSVFQFYAGTTETNATKISSSSYTFSKNDGWNIMVFDLAKCDKYTANDDGEYITKLIRMDVINPTNAGASGEKLPADQYVEIAFVAVIDSVEDAATYLEANAADKDICAHDEKYTDGNCNSFCVFCNKDLGVNHAVVETSTDDGNVRTTVSTCGTCEKELYRYTTTFGDTKPLHFISASDIVKKASKGNNIGGAVLSADGTYATVTNKKEAKDGYFSLVTGDVLSGQYVMVKYRTTNSDGWEWYIKSKGNGWSSPFYINPIMDGEWQTIIIDLTKPGIASWTPDAADGKYYANDIRWDIMNKATKEDRSVDVAFVAVSDNVADLLAINGTDAYILYDKFENNTGAHKPISAENDNPLFTPSYLVNKIDNSARAKLVKDEKTGLVYVKYIASKVGDEKNDKGQPIGEERFTIWNSASVTIPDSGNYLAYVYRRPTGSPSDSVDVFLNSTHTGANGSGDSNNSLAYIADGQWHIMIVDLTDNMDKNNTAYYDPAKGITGLQIDWFNGSGRTPGETYVDVAYVGMFDDRNQALDYYVAFLDKYGYECTHDSVTSVYTTNDADNNNYAFVSSTCSICSKELEVNKAPAVNNISDIGGYFSKVNSPVTTNPYLFNSTNSRYPAEGYMVPNSSKKVTIAGWGGALGKVTQTAYRVLDADGNVVIAWTTYNTVDLNPSDIEGIKNGVNGVLPGYGSAFRFNIHADLSSLYTEENYGKMFTVEFAYISNDEAVGNDKYILCGIFENVKIPTPYKANIGTYSVDGTAETTLQKGTENAPVTVDLVDVAVTKSLTAKGWCVTPNGIEKYTYRVTNSKGEATYYDIAAEGHYNGNDADIANVGISGGYGEDSKLNSNFQMSLPGLTVDLTAHDGDTVTVELIAVNNNGEELVILAFNNVTVGTPAAE